MQDRNDLKISSALFNLEIYKECEIELIILCVCV